MAIDIHGLFEEARREVEQEIAAGKVRRGGPSESVEGGKWAAVWSQHGESIGPFGGRNNALIKLVAFMRAKSIPYDAGRWLAVEWNKQCCVPPLPDSEILDTVSRLWAKWIEGGLNDDTPEDIKGGEEKAGLIKFLTFEEMAEEARKGGGQQWIVPNGLPSSGLVFLTAPPAGGKTWVLLDLVRAAATGGRWLGVFDVPRTPTLYIDEEMGAMKAHPRLSRLGMPEDCDLLYTNKAGIRLDDPRQVKIIVDTVKERGIGLVVVDTMTRVHRYDENDNSQMRLLYAKFSEIMAAGACVVVAHHERKGGQGDSSIGHERTRGASEISASADMCFSVEKRGGWHRLVSTKSRLVAEDDAIKADFIIEDSDDKTRVTLRPVDVEERSEMYVDKLEDQVLDYVSVHGPCNMVSIRKGVKGDETAKGLAISSLVDAGKITKERDGKSVLYSVSRTP